MNTIIANSTLDSSITIDSPIHVDAIQLQNNVISTSMDELRLEPASNGVSVIGSFR